PRTVTGLLLPADVLGGRGKEAPAAVVGQAVLHRGDRWRGQRRHDAVGLEGLALHLSALGELLLRGGERVHHLDLRVERRVVGPGQVELAVRAVDLADVSHAEWISRVET